MMKGGILALSLFLFLTLASQGSWCAAESSTSISADHHLQEQEFHGKKKLEIDISRKLGHGHSLTKHEDEVSAVEIKHHRRMAIGHKGGSVGGGAAGGGGRNMGGGGVATRPHGKKNGAAALPVPVASVLALSLACGLAFSVFSF
ncbi:hypothetical protein EJB05_08668 [Eragrostis curvula]|uniref:Uncharacterized protein n=1 Tax=Eragrostis curvula TaxID=38414 RepID=A0A5J9W439_9POAL|nr:hypothetical protein EJB05_08668 [Eragrostis curvula]